MRKKEKEIKKYFILKYEVIATSVQDALKSKKRRLYEISESDTPVPQNKIGFNTK